MDKTLYPPRFNVVVQAKEKFFFESSKYVNYQLLCGTEIKAGKLTVPSVGKVTVIEYNGLLIWSVDMFGASSSESDSSLKQKNIRSYTSGQL